MKSPTTFDLAGAVRRLLADESGEDIVESALLAAIVGIASIATWKLLTTSIGSVYGAADADIQQRSACTPDPGGSGCP